MKPRKKSLERRKRIESRHFKMSKRNNKRMLRVNIVL